MFSIRQRLTLWYTLVLMVLLVAFAAAVFAGGAYRLQRATDLELQLTARQLAVALLRNEDPVVVDTSYRLLALDGTVLRAAGLPAVRVPVNPAAVSAAAAGNSWYETVSINTPRPLDPSRSRLFTNIRMVTLPLGSPPIFILQVGKVADDIARLRSWLITTLLFALLLGLPLAALGGWWLAGRALSPVRAMTATARRIEASDLAERLPVPRHNDELRQLADTLNELLARLEAVFQRERRFTADVSHDLRTPLALAKSTIGVALNRPRSTGELRTTLAEVDRQIDRVTGLLDATLVLARADAHQLSTDYSPVDLSELLEDLAETTTAYAAEERNLTVTAAIAPGLQVQGDQDQLTRLFLNLLDNAMQYTPAGGTIRVAAHAREHQAVVEVADNGVGISAEDLPHVFDRFFRADRSRTNGGQDHHGLGLSIAQAIARAHGGEITASSARGQGSCFTVCLPRLEHADA